MLEKAGVVKYTAIMKRLFVLFSILVLPAIMICLVYAFLHYAAFYIITPALIVLYLVVYGVYALRVSLSAVTGMQVTDKVVYVKTKRKTYTYDVHMGCVGVKVTPRKFVCTFQTQDSRDSFIFYRRVLFSKYSEEQFTPEEIKAFYPSLEC